MVQNVNFKREAIFNDYPWMQITESKYPYLVIGDDLDAALSACLWNTIFPQDWEIVGIYSSYQNIYRKKDHDYSLANCIWLDLDIAQHGIKSIGHHILKIRMDDKHPMQRTGFNLNDRRGIYHGTFRHKYPLGTIHFLMYLFNQQIPDNDYSDEFIFLADSTWINGQSHRYRWNVEDWLQKSIPNGSLMDSMTSLTLFIAPHRLHFNAQKIAPHRFQSPQKCPFFSQKPEAVEWMQSNLGGKPY